MTAKEFLQLFGKYVRETRIEKGISINELAKLCSLSEHQLVQLENGKVDSPIDVLIEIAEVFDIELHEFISFGNQS